MYFEQNQVFISNKKYNSQTQFDLYPRFQFKLIKTNITKEDFKQTNKQKERKKKKEKCIN